MRVAFLVNEFPVLSETFILRQITGLMDRGAEVEIYAQRVHWTAPAHQEVAGYGLLSRAHELGSADRPARSAGARVLRRAQDIARRRRTLPARVFLDALNPLRTGKASLSLKSLHAAATLSAQRHDVLYAQFGQNGSIGVSLRELAALRAPVVTQFHGYDASSQVRQGGGTVYAELFEKGDLLLGVSDRIRQHLIELGASPARTAVHRCGIRTAQVPFVERAVEKQLQVLTVARLVEKKGIEFALQAIAELSRQRDVRYRIAGDGPLSGQLRARAQELGLSSTVEFLGPVSGARVNDLMAQASVLLVPSVTAADGDEEGIPVVLMEALACGLPVVATRHGGIPELVVAGHTGRLAEERDAAALSRLLQAVVDEPEQTLEMARRGRTLVEQNHDMDRLNDQLMDHFSATIDRYQHTADSRNRADP